MERRTLLKIVALGALSPRLDALGAFAHGHGSRTVWSPADYKLQFFTQAENQLLDQLMEMIIPADSHSGGAHAAQVSLFADLMVATSGDEVKKRWREGLRLMRQEAEKSSTADALAKAAAHEENPTTELEKFFTELKTMTVNGYYTSAIGIHDDLQYQGNTYLTEFPGCAHPEHRGE